MGIRRVLFFPFLCTFALGRKKTECERLFRAKKGKPHTFPQKPKHQKKGKRMTSEELKKVADIVTAQTIFTTKEVLTTEEAAAYMGMRKSYLYKLTMNKKIPHYKPMGKVCYFQRRELEEWLLSNRVATDEELSEKAQDYCTRKGGIK